MKRIAMKIPLKTYEIPRVKLGRYYVLERRNGVRCLSRDFGRSQSDFRGSLIY